MPNTTESANDGANDKRIVLQGHLFRQNEKSPVQFSFIANSCDIDSWAKVPTKLSRYPRGFQRPVMRKHREDVARFFREDVDHVNCSPTSILLALEPEKQSTVA